MLFHMCGVCVVRLIMFNYDQLYVVVWVFLVCVLFLLLLFFHFIFFFSFFFLMIRRPPRSTPFPTRRSSDLACSGDRFLSLPRFHWNRFFDRFQKQADRPGAIQRDQATIAHERLFWPKSCPFG